MIRPDGKVHDWSIHYHPHAANGRGSITVTFDGRRDTLDLPGNARREGATFDRFGLFNIQSGGNHVEVYIDDLSYKKLKR